MKKILSIDGGGIRGIIPARILADIESQTNKQIFELFDLIVGTSTGGIIALGLVKPHSIKKNSAKYSAEEIAELYEKNGKKFSLPKYRGDGMIKYVSYYNNDTVMKE